MLATIEFGFLLGTLVSVALVYSFREYIQVKTDAKTQSDLKWQIEEILRLRAQVALHINEDKGSGKHDRCQ